MNDKQKQQELTQMIDAALPGYLPVCLQPEQRVADAMRYSLLSGGKRIRGVLLLSFYELFRSDLQAALPYAAAVEMVHAYSLIHDDLPCMDDDDVRRGMPSCHKAFDEATALLAGDALLTLAFETMTAPKHAEVFESQSVLTAVSCLARAGGTGGMIGGQMADLALENSDTVPPEVLRRMYAGKTGALIAAACRTGAILAGAEESVQDSCSGFGFSLGLVFQIVDDILDVEGDEAVLGKPVGSDAKNSKSSWPCVFGMEQARATAMEMNAKAKEALDRIPADTAFLSALSDRLLERQF